MIKKLLEVSAIPARALYQAANAANIPKAPPARMQPVFGAPVEPTCRYPIANIRNAMSRVKKRKKNATVDFSVQMRRRKVKIN